MARAALARAAPLRCAAGIAACSQILGSILIEEMRLRSFDFYQF